MWLSLKQLYWETALYFVVHDEHKMTHKVVHYAVEQCSEIHLSQLSEL